MLLVFDKLKPTIKLLTPNFLHQFAREYLARTWDTKYEGRPVEEIFSAIYREGKWGSTCDGALECVYEFFMSLRDTRKA